jgi:hypothetical protein
MHDGVTPGTGVGLYTFDVNGATTTYAAPSTEIIVAPTLHQIGVTGATLVQNGKRVTLSAAGTGFDNTSDQLALAGWPLTGDFDVYVDLAAFTGAGYEYATAVLMWRDVSLANVTTVTGAKFGSIGYWRSADNIGIDFKGRSVLDQVYDIHQFVTGSGSPGWLHIRRRSNNFTYRYSADGSLFNTLYSETRTASSTLMVGVGVSDNQATPVTMTAVFDDVHYTQGADVVHTINSTDPTTRIIKVKARDASAALNETAYTATQSAVPGVASSSVKFRPGLWPEPNFVLSYTSDTDYWDGVIQPFIDNVGTLAEVTGLMFLVTIGVLSKDQGDYSEGEAVIDELDARMRAIGKPYLLHIWDRKFGGSLPTVPQSSSTRAFADWHISGNHVASGSFTHYLKIWNATEMGYLIDVYRHFGDYLDSNAYCEGFENAESAMDSTAPTWSYSGMRTQTYRFIDEVGPKWPTSLKRYNLNFYDTYDQTGINNAASLVSYLYGAGWGIGGPDMYTTTGPSMGEGIVRGLGSYSPGVGEYGFQPDFGSIDYRSLMSVAYHMEYIHTRSKEVVYAYSHDQIMNHYLHWSVATAGELDQQGAVITTANAWPAVYAYLASQAEPITNITRPANI